MPQETRHQEFLKFLRRLDQRVPRPKSRCIWSWTTNGTHKHESQQWLKPSASCSFRTHHSSWLNLVERWFGTWTTSHPRGVFRSVADLQASIDAFLQAWNQNPKPFVCDRHRRIHSGETQPLPSNPGENPTRRTSPKTRKRKAKTA